MKPYLWVRRSAKNIWVFSEDEQEGLGWFPLYTKPEEECITPKKELSLVEELRNHALPDPYDEREVLHAPLLKRAADRIESLEIANESLSLERRSTDELLAELRSRMLDRTVKEME